MPCEIAHRSTKGQRARRERGTGLLRFRLALIYDPCCQTFKVWQQGSRFDGLGTFNSGDWVSHCLSSSFLLLGARRIPDAMHLGCLRHEMSAVYLCLSPTVQNMLASMLAIELS